MDTQVTERNGRDVWRYGSSYGERKVLPNRRFYHERRSAYLGNQSELGRLMSMRVGAVIRFMRMGVGVLHAGMRGVMCVQMSMLMAVRELPMGVFVCMHVFVSVRTLFSHSDRSVWRRSLSGPFRLVPSLARVPSTTRNLRSLVNIAQLPRLYNAYRRNYARWISNRGGSHGNHSKNHRCPVMQLRTVPGFVDRHVICRRAHYPQVLE